MADKRSYRDIVISVETSLNYINNHLQNIDGHLNKLNERTKENEVSSSKNSNNIKWILRIGGSFLVFVIIPVVLKLLGIY